MSNRIKVCVEIKARILMDMDAGLLDGDIEAEVDNVINEMDYEFISDSEETKFLNSEITDYEIMSKIA